MEQFLYILVVIVWIAFSLYRSQKKQREKAAKLQNSSMVTSKQSPKFNLESIFEELLGNKNNIFASVDASPSNIQNNSFPKNSSYENIQKESESLESESLENIPKRPPTSVITATKYTPIPHAITTENDKIKTVDFDLKKAFIYQTILTRPYN